jgi:hypothetical protein
MGIWDMSERVGSRVGILFSHEGMYASAQIHVKPWKVFLIILPPWVRSYSQAALMAGPIPFLRIVVGIFFKVARGEGGAMCYLRFSW